jgi:hypothetical protein
VRARRKKQTKKLLLLPQQKARVWSLCALEVGTGLTPVAHAHKVKGPLTALTLDYRPINLIGG